MASGLLEQWQKLELLHDLREVSRLRRELLERGRGVSRHQNAELDVFAFVHWEWGVGDYACLVSRDDFLQDCPEERGAAGYLTGRSKRVEFGNVQLDARSRKPEELGEHKFLGMFLQQTHTIRARCGLGNGYLVQLGQGWLTELDTLTLLDVRLDLHQAMKEPPSSGLASRELVEFDARMEQLLRGA